MGDPVVHFEISSRNAQRLAEFYAQAFGWKAPWAQQLNYALIDTQSKGHGINGGIGDEQGGQNRVTFYIEVPDTDAALRKIERLGGRTLVPTETIPGAGVTFAMFADPEGNAIGLTKMTPAPAQPSSRTNTAAKKKTTARKRTTARKKTGARGRR